MRQQGFTIIELMITVALIAIVAGIGIPSFRDLVASNRVVSSINEFHAGLRLARIEAVKRNDTVIFCASSDQASCNGNWGDGWIIYHDGNGDDVVNASELIRVGDPVNAGYSLTFSGAGNAISFAARGLSNQSGTFKLCDSEGDAGLARGIILLSTGLTRRSLDTDGSGIHEDNGGTDFSC
ncbi:MULTISPECIES: GspH/FimT family pseudopilin [unclassified Ketobacter]|uniref:GspH/FimT family pseudopilin n=1 Tax=unclassified Ketobacter TaxID=2639109 RepID=UPI000F0F77C0|nr:MULTISPECIES: GspH/FimT family pseudopilin [unclassified Ketobacter]RLT88213.1 MAG: prepilin-type N-terminal cleavage/methylation domain-containing protein [Ketobacter sp. GenoA1]RLT94143.1 MAG: prepilin-type N-terminal cleavage/methylation domain-containing protein [Ketobacter sp.]